MASTIEVGSSLTEPPVVSSPDDGARPSDPATGVSIGTVVGLVLVAFGLIIGVRTLGDNSFLTHLATGRLMLDDGIVRHDVFTWTANGEPLVVQSWLASLLYAVTEEVAGGAGIRVMTGVVCLLLAAGLWSLTRPMEGLVARVAVAGGVIYIGASFWTHRPLIFGLLGLLAVVFVLERRVSPVVLVPVMYVWVQVHGSFPMGIGLIVCTLLGTRLDGRPLDVPLRSLKWAIAGVGLGGLLNPYGPKLVLFPITMLGRDDMLKYVREWRSPDLHDWFARAFVLLMCACIVALMRKSSWSRAFPVMVFVVAGFMAQRNIPLATIVMVPLLVDGFATVGGIRSDERRSIYRPAAFVLLLGLVAIAGGAAIGPAYGLDRYPVEEVAWLAEHDLFGDPHRVVHPDIAGNYIEWALGTDAATFVDDRYELHSRATFDDYLVIDDGRPGWDEALDRLDADIVLWPVRSPLVELLRIADGWEIARESERWVIACRDGVCPIEAPVEP